MSVRLLLAEDDPRIAAVLQRGLEAEGYSVDTARNGREALACAMNGQFSLIILDRRMPDMDGLEVCRRLRQAGSKSLVLMLTAKDALQDKVDGLKSGADDYVTKPFAFHEVLARIEALLRRYSPEERPKSLEVGDLRLDLGTKVAWRGQREVALTAREFALLDYLMTRAGEVVSQKELLEQIWNLSFDPGTKVVEVHVRLLRRKIDGDAEKSIIKTVRGFGYMIARAVEE